MTPDHEPHASRLIDLANGLLSDVDAGETMEHIRHCAECEERFRVLIADRESVRSGPAPTLVDGRIHLPAGSRRPSMLVRASLVAALFAIIALGVFMASNRDDGPADYWIPVTDEAVVLRSQKGKSDVTDVLKSYQQHDAERAIEELRELEPLPGDKTSSTLRDLYLASALINAGRAHEGLEVLDRLDIQFMPTPWRYEAEWVKYIGLRRAGRDSEARSWLERLSAEPGENRARAQSELNRAKTD